MPSFYRLIWISMWEIEKQLGYLFISAVQWAKKEYQNWYSNLERTQIQRHWKHRFKLFTSVVKCNKLLKAGRGETVWDQEILCVLPNDLQTTLGIFMLELRNRSKSHAKTKQILLVQLRNFNYWNKYYI